MKATVAILLTLVMLLGILGCASTDANRGDNAQPTGENGTPSPEATAPSKTGGIISEEAAWQLALEHAGLTKDQVTNARVVLDKDNGKLEYEVEFHQGTVEFDYEIDAATGEIISFDRDDD